MVIVIAEGAGQELLPESILSPALEMMLYTTISCPWKLYAGRANYSSSTATGIFGHCGAGQAVGCGGERGTHPAANQAGKEGKISVQQIRLERREDFLVLLSSEGREETKQSVTLQYPKTVMEMTS
ncbi:hypothetical protein D5086_001737 [Populus alba]|uniref:Uncharacterized protein n=1 Tax=Populus alba TaxID=43335 RepID=A0ACC4CZS0_POPAL